MDLRLAHTLRYLLEQKCWQEKITREEPVHFAPGWRNLCKANWVFKWLWAKLSELLLLFLLLVKVVVHFWGKSSAWNWRLKWFMTKSMESLTRRRNRGSSRSTAFSSSCKLRAQVTAPEVWVYLLTPEKFFEEVLMNVKTLQVTAKVPGQQTRVERLSVADRHVSKPILIIGATCRAFCVKSFLHWFNRGVERRRNPLSHLRI